jgi:hypothetical protein
MYPNSQHLGARLHAAAELNLGRTEEAANAGPEAAHPDDLTAAAGSHAGRHRQP